MTYNSALSTLHNSIVTGNVQLTTPLVRTNPRMTAEEQIAIYCNAYKTRLRTAVYSDYQCLAHYLGDAAMHGLVDAYIDVTPSMSYSLDFYPHKFWQFVQNSDQSIAIKELAELEGAIAETFMGKGSDALTPENLPPLNKETLGQIKFNLRTPHRLLNFTHDVEAAMASFKCGDAITITPKPVHLYVYRHDNEVQRRHVEEGEFHLLKAIDQTDSLEVAISHANISEATLADGISRWLPHWIGEGFFALDR